MYWKLGTCQNGQKMFKRDNPMFLYNKKSLIKIYYWGEKMDITLDDIKAFSKKYKNNPTNKMIENAIANNGIESAMLNRDIIAENQPVFNIELPGRVKKYSQKASELCWVYAGFNVIQANVANHLNIDIEDLELSAEYISFFDRLEKSSAIYEKIIQLEDVSYEHINKNEFIVKSPIGYGLFEFFRGIVNKYGFVPNCIMPQTKGSIDANKINTIYREKLRGDIVKLIKLKEKNAKIEELENKRKEFLEENYMLLSKILGEPIQQFTYEYIDKEGNFQRLENITPLEFKEKFLTIDLNEFICIANIPRHNKPYGKVYQYTNYPHIESYTFLNLPINDLKRLGIAQLKDNIPVYVNIYRNQFRDTSSGVLDTRLYDYKQTLGVTPLTKEEGQNTNSIAFHHCMAICGVHIIDDKPIRWKIEDSYGTECEYKGYNIMNDNYFEKYVFGIIIHKKYLSQEQLEAWNQQPIEFSMWT